MVIWLKTDPKVVALDTDVVRAEDRGRVTELADALEALHEVVAATMTDATERARALVEKARCEAEAFVAGAQRKFDNSARLGYAAGHQRALDETHARFVAAARDEQAQLRACADRLSRIVMKAVEQVVAESDRDALMRRVALTVSRSIDNAAHMSVTVAPADAERARRLFGELARTAEPSLAIEIVVDDQAEPGTCICEWDYGVVEAKLGAQLRALSRALSKGAADAVRSARGAREAFDDDEDDEDRIDGGTEEGDAGFPGDVFGHGGGMYAGARYDEER
ncbi:type III secretion system stator protein SctL [Trinickia caryophylli]|uniref:Type 3 secretion system stator protein n=1 Tax=Trinickia caryophylli TaxID=28094 RepID=A0A1X7D654_TRICW|nr:type III secretion system stator protein SctL [Trinickia caryophylli]WQE14955.1 type III secretion system stator protein SctL [Trinickia caryophylli]GLU31316.1 type III secretion system protein [Trinickia caryophylli]SMF09546.1 type III secretion protein L [Trinickia caryophylli]